MGGFDVCNDSDQYVKFKELVSKLDDASFWDLIKCTPRCKFTKYILKPMVESNYNDLLYKTGKSDGANLAVMKFKYRIVASTNTCFYSENQIFDFLKYKDS